MVYPLNMKPPIFACPLSDAERETLKAGLRSPDASTLRRCQILIASADETKNAYQIARELGCHDQTARNAIHVDGTPEVAVGCLSFLAQGLCGHAELEGRLEVFEDLAPVALVLGAPAVAFVDDYKVE